VRGRGIIFKLANNPDSILIRESRVKDGGGRKVL
jgi:hypothetical protein